MTVRFKLHSDRWIKRRVSVKRKVGVGVYLFIKECCFRVRVRADTSPNPIPNPNP